MYYICIHKCSYVDMYKLKALLRLKKRQWIITSIGANTANSGAAGNAIHSEYQNHVSSEISQSESLGLWNNWCKKRNTLQHMFTYCSKNGACSVSNGCLLNMPCSISTATPAVHNERLSVALSFLCNLFLLRTLLFLACARVSALLLWSYK